MFQQYTKPDTEKKNTDTEIHVTDKTTDLPFVGIRTFFFFFFFPAKLKNQMRMPSNIQQKINK